MDKKNNIKRIFPLKNGLNFILQSNSMIGATKFLINEIFDHRSYYRKGFEININDIVVDIGANMGLFSLWAASQASNGRIIAIEPTNVIECLKMNIKYNGLTNIEVIKAALGKDNNYLEIITYPGFNIISHNSNWKPAKLTLFFINLLFGKYKEKPVIERSKVISLDKIIKDYNLNRIDFLKIDCEGSEYEIFQNLSKSGFEKINKIVIEFHEFKKGQNYKILVGIFKKNNFKVTVKKNIINYYLMKYGLIWAWK